MLERCCIRSLYMEVESELKSESESVEEEEEKVRSNKDASGGTDEERIAKRN